MVIGSAFPGTPQNGATCNEALERASVALNNQRPEDAERLAGEVLKSDPRRTRALHILGCALLAQGRADKAIAPLETAARGTHDPEIDTALATALRRTDRLNDALSRLKRTVKRHPRFAPTFRELGSLLFAMGHFDEAIVALKRDSMSRR